MIKEGILENQKGRKHIVEQKYRQTDKWKG